jgi:hypothetical protein
MKKAWQRRLAEDAAFEKGFAEIEWATNFPPQVNYGWAL